METIISEPPRDEKPQATVAREERFLLWDVGGIGRGISVGVDGMRLTS